jgi:hypothetical protein
MRYRNRESGVDLDSTQLDGERKAFFLSAVKQFHADVNWFEFERIAFGFRSPVFQQARSRQDVLTDPLFLALKDMWLRLGVEQGLVAPNTEVPGGPKSTKGRKAHSNRAPRVRHVAASNKPRVPAKRGR